MKDTNYHLCKKLRKYIFVCVYMYFFFFFFFFAWRLLGTMQETGDSGCFRGVSDYGTEWKNFHGISSTFYV